MARFVLIGGKNKDTTNNYLETKIIELSLVKKPKILFCAFATINDIDKYNEKFKSQMAGLDCEIYYMHESDILNFSTLLEWCDVFYCNGGSSDDLVKLFKDNKLDEVMKSKLYTNKLFCGISAGAMLYTSCGMGDKYAFLDNFKMYNYKMVKCLGFLPITICPHYQNPELIIYNDEVKKYDLVSFAIEDDTMLYIEDCFYKVYKACKSNSVYEFDSKKNYLMIPLYEGEAYEKDWCIRS